MNCRTFSQNRRTWEKNPVAAVTKHSILQNNVQASNKASLFLEGSFSCLCNSQWSYHKTFLALNYAHFWKDQFYASVTVTEAADKTENLAFCLLLK